MNIWNAAARLPFLTREISLSLALAGLVAAVADGQGVAPVVSYPTVAPYADAGASPQVVATALCPRCGNSRCQCQPYAPVVPCPPSAPAPVVEPRRAPIVDPNDIAPGLPSTVPPQSPESPQSPQSPQSAPQLASNTPSLSMEGSLAGPSGVPSMLADNFGGGGGTTVSILPVPTAFSFNAVGFITSGLPGDANASLVYETTAGPADDFTSLGVGFDTNGDGAIDTFRVNEPVPPTDAPIATSPGAIFLGGTAFDPSANATTDFQDGDTWQVNYEFAELQEVTIPVGGGGGGAVLIGRQKISENNSPMPRDRVLFNYSLFKNAPLSKPGVTVNRFTTGIEKTFLNKNASIEWRVPMAATVSSDIMLGEGVATGRGEFGDMMLTFKLLLWQDDKFALSTGMGVTLPTADDLRVYLTPDWEFARIQNRSVHLMPFVGMILVPHEKLFLHSFVQVDVDGNGNRLMTNFDDTALTRVGRLQDAAYIYTDIGLGYWLYQADRNSSSCITGIAPTLELHYNASLSNSDSYAAGNVRIGERRTDVQTLNAVVGATARVGDNGAVQVGYATGVGNSADHQFDGELRVLVNRNF